MTMTHHMAHPHLPMWAFPRVLEDQKALEELKSLQVEGTGADSRADSRVFLLTLMALVELQTRRGCMTRQNSTRQSPLRTFKGRRGALPRHIHWKGLFTPPNSM